MYLLSSCFYFSRSSTLTTVSVLVTIMAPSTRQTKRKLLSSEDPDLAGPQQKEKRARRSEGGTTLSPIVEVTNSAKEHCAEPDTGAKPSLIVTIPCSAKEHCTEPDAGATPSLIVTFPCPAKEHPTTSDSMENSSAKAPRGRTPRNKQKADQQHNSFSDPRPKSWGMPEVWAKVFHNLGYNRHLILKIIA